MPGQTTKNKPDAASEQSLKATATDKSALTGGQKVRTWITSTAIVAIVLAYAVDLSARFLVKKNNYAQPNTTWAWWVTNSYRDNGPADIAILGSSLMVQTTTEADAQYTNKMLDQVTHHRSLYLEHLLQKRGFKNTRTQAFAIGGQMASDSYSITSALLTGENKPKEVIWGIAPRDFVDATFTDPSISETAKYMRKVSDNKDILGVRDSFTSRMEDGMSAILFLYKQRWQILAAQHDWTSELLQRLGWQIPSPNQFPESLKQFAATHFDECEPKDKWLVGPNANQPFKDNSDEYKARYQPFKKKLYDNQLRYFAKTLQYFRNNQIPLTLVNMPITKMNEDLMVDGEYARYMSDTQRLAKEYSAKFIDLNDHNEFPKTFYTDTVHMNGAGSMKFWDLVAKNWQ